MPKALEYREGQDALAKGVESNHIINAAHIIVGIEIKLINGDKLVADVADDGAFRLYYPGT